MARIKLGSIVTAISGKLGENVFSRNSGGAYVKANVTPTNPQTPAQTAVRIMMADVSSTWKTLTDTQRDTWHKAVNEFTRTDQFGDIKRLTGKSLFQSLNQNLVLTGQDQITIAPISLNVPQPMFSSVNGDVGSQSIDLELENDTTSNVIQVFATPPLSQGIRYVKNRVRKIGNFTGGPSGTILVGPEYVAKFGAFADNDNIHFAVNVVSKEGKATPMAYLKGVIEL